MLDRFPVLVLVVILAACSSPASTTPSNGTASVPMRSESSRPSHSAEPSTPPSSEPTPQPSSKPLAWRDLDLTGPAAREDHTWTVGGDGRSAYLFGGRDGATVFGDLWAFDLETDTWTELNPGPGPAARFGHEAVWVDDIGLVVFAGQAGPTFFNDLWAFEPTAGSWARLPSSGAVPVSRYGTCAAVSPDGRLWISHGFTSDGARFSDTRSYNFESGAWTDETPADGGRPVERCLHGCWWTDAGELALYAGQTTGVTALGDRWTFADGAWASVEGSLPPDRNLYARTRLSGATLVFGGQALDGSYLADLWLLRDSEADAISLATDGGPPSGRAGAELIRDAAGERVLLFGGRDGGGAHADLWELSGAPLGD
ncbi:MAG: kelch repeat-containing protein [Candidatus Limnocylindria bacterium]